MRVIEDEDALLPPSHKGPYKFDYNQLSDEERKHYNLLSPEEKTQYQDAEKTIFDHMNSPAVESKLQGEIGQAVHEANLETPRDPAIPEKIKEGLFAMGETDPQDTGEDGDFEGNDITSTAHGELEQHREMREYARIAAWEMPMLSSMSSISK